MESIHLTGPAGHASIFRYGAHLSEFTPRDQTPLLFLSSRSFFQSGKPIRGGVPVIFPWFGPREPDKLMHGLVRTRDWKIVEQSASKVVLRIGADDETRAAWPHQFDLTLAVTVGDKLTMEMTTTNPSSQPFTFEQALHTYYLVGDVRKVRLFGLTGATFVDRTVSQEPDIDRADPLTFTRALDRVYTGTTANCRLEDPVLKRRIFIEKENSRSAIVWNPWDEKIKTFIDLAPDEWIKYICVETGNVKADAITLPPGQSHTMTLRISTSAL